MISSCDNCGKDVNVVKSRDERNENNFCNRDCYLEWHSSDSEPCANCGKETNANGAGRNFCDRECYLNHHKSTENINCFNCGKSFEATQSRRNRVNNLFCDRACYIEHHGSKVDLNCDNCKKSIVLAENQITDNNFCGKACYYEWLTDEMSGKGNHQYIHGKDERGFTPSEREKIFKRDGYSCKDCDRSNTYLNAHHIKPVSKYPDLEHDINNGITLCIECHANRHKQKGDDTISKLIRNQPTSPCKNRKT